MDEYALPENASIVQLHMLSRHGARYPTSSEGVAVLGQKITNHTAGHRFEGPLGFLNAWEYKLGAAILVPIGKQELFDSGTLHQVRQIMLITVSITLMFFVRSCTGTSTQITEQSSLLVLRHKIA